MKIGAMNNPQKSIYDEIDFIGKSGFDFIDLTLEPTGAYPEDIDTNKIRSLLKKYRLAAVGHTPWSYPAASPVSSLRTATYKEFQKCFSAFHKIGIRKVTVHPSVPREKLGSDLILKYNLLFLEKMVRSAASKGIEVMVENIYPPFDDLEIFTILLEEVPLLKMHIDVGHLNLGGDAPLKLEAFFRVHRKKIVHMHFSDNHGSEDEHLPLGVGNIDWHEVVRILEKYNYDRTITLEIHASDRSYLDFSRKKLLKMLSVKR